MKQPDRRVRPAQRNLHLFEVVVVTAFIGIIAFCAYDGFKEIFTSPQPCMLLTPIRPLAHNSERMIR